MPDWVPSSATAIRSECLVAATWPGTRSRTASASASLGGDQHRAGQRVVLGLADQVGGDVRRVGGVVGEDGDLGGAGLGVDADQPAQQPLGRRHVDVARAGDHVDRLAGAGAVAEDGDRLGAADGVDLGDAEQGAGGEHAGVGQAAVVALRRRGDRDRLHAGDLRRDDVHDHAGQQRRQTAGHVEAHPAHRHPALGHRAAGHDLGGDVGAALVGVHLPDPGDRLLERRPQRRVALGERAVQRGLRHGEVLGVHAVEPRGDLADRLGAADAHVLAQRADRGHDRVDVGGGARQQAGEVARPGQRGSAQVDAGEHGGLRDGGRADVQGSQRRLSSVASSGGRSRPYAAGMGELIPLFPLGTPLFPGVVLPLQIFEPRYRRLMRDLLALPEDGDRRFFGVVAIRQGWEVEQVAPAEALYDIGCTARLQAVRPQPDGGFRIVTVGGDRFRLLDVVVGEDPPYLQARGRVARRGGGRRGGGRRRRRLIAGHRSPVGSGRLRRATRTSTRSSPRSPADSLALLAAGVRELFTRYVAEVADLGAGSDGEDAEAAVLLAAVADDPAALSYLVASAALLTTEDRQALLAESATRRRLAARRGCCAGS